MTYYTESKSGLSRIHGTDDHRLQVF